MRSGPAPDKRHLLSRCGLLPRSVRWFTRLAKPFERRWPHPSAAAGPPGRSAGGRPRLPPAATKDCAGDHRSLRLQQICSQTSPLGRNPGPARRSAGPAGPFRAGRAPRSAPKSRSAIRTSCIHPWSFPAGRRGRAVIREGSMFPFERASALCILTITFA
jgi:hypothetical protein